MSNGNGREFPAIKFSVQLAGAVHTVSYTLKVDTEEEAQALYQSLLESIAELYPGDTA